jgi:hypothetical protein
MAEKKQSVEATVRTIRRVTRKAAAHRPGRLAPACAPGGCRVHARRVRRAGRLAPACAPGGCRVHARRVRREGACGLAHMVPGFSWVHPRRGRTGCPIGMTVQAEQVRLKLEPRFVSLLLTRYRRSLVGSIPALVGQSEVQSSAPSSDRPRYRTCLCPESLRRPTGCAPSSSASTPHSTGEAYGGTIGNAGSLGDACPGGHERGKTVHPRPRS